MVGSASLGNTADRRPGNGLIGVKSAVDWLLSSTLDSVAGFAMLLKGSLPGRKALLVKVRGVVNLETLKVLGFGVAPNRLEEDVERIGDPPAETFVGDGGRLAGDCSNEALNGEAVGADGGAIDILKGGCMRESPSTTLFGDSWMVLFQGLWGMRRAGLAIIEEPRSCVVEVRFTTIDVVKLSFLEASSTLAEALKGLLVRGLIGVFSMVASSSSEPASFAVAT
jgi:hypothetical protein